jgi:hypothetical protein
MAIIARVFGWSLLAGGLGAGLGLILFAQHNQYSDYIIPTLFLGCVGGIIGAVAGAAAEIVPVLHDRVSR